MNKISDHNRCKSLKQPKLTGFIKNQSKKTAAVCNEVRTIDSNTLNFSTFNVTVDTVAEDAEVVSNDFADISPCGLLKNMEPQLLPVVYAYPVTDKRKFNKKWVNDYVWLEYSLSKDSCFCYPCRQFSPTHERDNVFKYKGFSHWKTALETNKGFKKHEKSNMHLSSMAKWAEAINRQRNNSSVFEMATDNVLEFRRNYVKTIIEVIIFLVKNELSFRGSYNIENQIDEGLFEKLFKYTKANNENISKWESHMPHHYTYRSPQIQNELIELLTLMVRETVANDVMKSDVPYFTLLEDGTKDKKNNECVAIAARYVLDGQVHESIITMATFAQLNAAYFTQQTLKILKDIGIHNGRMLSQCYDGASVMSGKDGGVQKLIQDTLKRKIPYFHCLSHQLHLVIVKAIESVQLVKQFFDQAKHIAKFFRRHKVQQHYKGHSILKLIETYLYIVNTLPQISGAGFDGDDVAIAAGLLHVMTSPEFVFALVFTKDLLQTIEPLTNQIQGRAMGYKDSMPLIRAVYTTIEKKRSQESFDKYYSQTGELLEKSNFTEPAPSHRPIRSTRLSTMMKNFVIEEKIGERSESTLGMKSAFYETIDVVIIEMTNRFIKNDAFLTAIDTADEMDLEKLRPLADLGIQLPSAIELAIAKEYINEIRTKNEQINNENPKDGNIKTMVLAELYKVRHGMKNVYNLYATIATFPSGTEVCESSFSALTRIMRPQRISMATDRLNNLAFLAFESKRLQTLDIDYILRRFSNLKQRKVQLF